MAEIKIDQTWLWSIGYENPVPPPERQVKRLFCLVAYHALAQTAHAIQMGTSDGIREHEFYQSVYEWVKQNAEDELTSHERTDFGTDPGQWHPKSIVDGGWSFQAAGTIAWALGLCKWKPMWESFDDGDLTQWILDESVNDVLQRAKLKTLEEMELKNSISCAWAWRARNERNRDKGFLKDRWWRKYLRAWTDQLAATGKFDPIVDGDYSVSGIPFGKLPQDRQLQIGSSAFERLRALNWLCGQEPNYEDITCDT